jgi:hypothetical protein
VNILYSTTGLAEENGGEKRIEDEGKKASER